MLAVHLTASPTWAQQSAKAGSNYIDPVMTSAGGHADSVRPPAGHTRVIRPEEVDAQPIIDGRLDDEMWQRAPSSGDFWRTANESWPDEPTEVLILTDGEMLYVAFRAYDSMPDDIHAIEVVRDRGLGLDDQVAVEIDSYGDHKGLSRFSVNALGTQSDSLAGGRASRVSWKGDWNAAVTRTEDGWTAEMAIPYEILNYRPDANQFAVNFARYHHRTRQWSRWADVTPQNKKEEMGRLAGIEVPAGRSNDTWTFMPFALAGVNVVDREGEFQDTLFTGGMDILFTPTSNMTGVLSINPDFTQVETQITSANFSYNEQSVSDPRVFFQEGSAYYGNDIRIFYSPRVPDFIGGVKLFGQEGAFRYGGFVTYSPDSRVDATARMAFAVDPTHGGSLILVGTDRDELQGTTIAFAADGREKLGTYWNVDLASASNKISDEETVTGTMYEARGGWQADYWGFGLTLDDYDKEFIPANGINLGDNLGTNSRSVYTNYYQLYGEKIVSEGRFNIVHTDRETDDGRTQYEGWYVDGSLEWISFVRTGLSYSNGDYRPLTGEAPGDFGDQVNHDRFWTVNADFNTRGSRIGYGASYSSGELGGGDYEYIYGYLWSRPTVNTTLSVNVERLESFGTYRQYVTQAGWDINQANALVFRHIFAEGAQFWRLGYRRVVRSGLDIFLLYDEEPGADAALSLKLLWTIS